jgi:hypothetical protein
MLGQRASRRKYHIIYKTTCKITGKWYIGMHSTDDLEDNYLGSGVRLRRSVIKYGKDNHIREILEIFNTRIEASEKEKTLLTEEFRSDPMCMNCGPGGEGTIDRPATKDETRQKLSIASKKYIRTKEWYDKVVETRIKNGTNKHTKETKQKISISQTSKKISEESIAKTVQKNKGQKRTPEQCANISKALKGKLLGIPKAPFSNEHKENIRLARIGKKHSEEAKSNMRKSKDMKANMKQCTIDGIIIYMSKKALLKELGKGKNGFKHPNFRYI